MRLVLVGTGHVLDLAVALRDLIHTERPLVVALELDADRYHGLREREAMGPPTQPRKDVGRVYRYLAKFQESIGDAFGVQPGSEMLAAAKAAQEVGARIALVDRNAQAVVQDAIRRMTFREKARFVLSSIVGWWPGKQKERVEAELARYQQEPERYLDELGRQFPTIRRALIDERDEHMAKKIRELATTTDRVVAVVGDGHVNGMAKILADLNPLVIRLKELRTRKTGAPAMQWRMNGTTSVGFSFGGQSFEDQLRRD